MVISALDERLHNRIDFIRFSKGYGKLNFLCPLFFQPCPPNPCPGPFKIMEERLQKILARAGICSRRKAEEHIREGKVTIDGIVVTEMGIRVDPDVHHIEFEGKPLAVSEKKVYILLNKPKGYVTTMRDPQGRPIVTSLLKNVPERVFPVGRLDQDTEGALLLTNDGDFAQNILHPKFEINRTYLAIVAGRPSRELLLKLEQGIEIENRRTWPARIKVLTTKKRKTTVEIIIHEGRKRQVRKMFAAIGHTVLELKRTAYGRLKLGRLSSGKYRFLSKKEITLLFS